MKRVVACLVLAVVVAGCGGSSDLPAPLLPGQLTSGQILICAGLQNEAYVLDQTDEGWTLTDKATGTGGWPDPQRLSEIKLLTDMWGCTDIDLAEAPTDIDLAEAPTEANVPQSWAEAGEEGQLARNFLEACEEAQGTGIELNADQIATYCECAFVEIVEYFGGEVSKTGNLYSLTDAAVAAESGRDFAAFKELESALQDNPEDIPADIRVLLAGQGGCTDQALTSDQADNAGVNIEEEDVQVCAAANDISEQDCRTILGAAPAGCEDFDGYWMTASVGYGMGIESIEEGIERSREAFC